MAKEFDFIANFDFPADWDVYVCKCSFNGTITDCCEANITEEGTCDDCGANDFFILCKICDTGEGCENCPDCGLEESELI